VIRELELDEFLPALLFALLAARQVLEVCPHAPRFGFALGIVRSQVSDALRVALLHCLFENVGHPCLRQPLAFAGFAD
jgi:hypothetical protein